MFFFFSAILHERYRSLSNQKVLVGAYIGALNIIVHLAHNGTEKRVFRPQCSFDVTAQI